MSATQVGKSFAEACWILYRAWVDPSRVHPWWWTAQSYEQTKPGFNYLRQLAVSAGIVDAIVQTPPAKLKLINGSVIEFRSRDNFEGMMGTPIAGAVADEAGQMSPEQQAALSTRRSATLGPIHWIGNPGMRAGPFRRLCARAGTEGHLHRWTWEDRHSILEGRAADEYKAFIESERGDLPDFEFRRLYLAEWTEDEAAVFRHVQEVTDGKPLMEAPPGERYAIGVDVGQQVDYLVAIGVGIHSNRADWMERFRNVPYPQAADRLMERVKKFPGVFIIEVNGPGLGLYQELRRRGARCYAFDTTSRSKEDLITRLAGALNPGESRLKLAEMAPLQHELSVFRYMKRGQAMVTYSYSAPPGEHDDCVMSLALGHHGRRLVMAYQPEQIRRVRVG